jgi:hypothetical protein
VLPFSHVQFAGDGRFSRLAVAEGEARVAAYVSQVNRTGDPMFIPAETLPSASRLNLSAPAISVDRWRTDVWLSSDTGVTVDIDPLRLSGAPSRTFSIVTFPNELAGSRVHSSNGTDQFVPFVDFPEPGAEQQLLFIESTPPYRTNIGIFTSLTREATAEVIVYDAAGSEVQREVLSTVLGVAQMPVLPRITGGRAVVRFLGGPAVYPRYAYASLIDNRTGDATFIAGQ